jgi:hypothetical protein
MEKKKIILPNLKYENAPDIDSQLRVGFEEEKSLLRTDDRDVVLNLSEQFATERANCKRYKLYGKMKMIFRNLYAGNSDYPYLREKLSLVGDGSDYCFGGYLPYDEFAFLRTDAHREITSGVSISDLSNFTGFTITTCNTGTTTHQEITVGNAYQFNWNVYLTYVFSHNESYPMKYTLSGNTAVSPLLFVSGDGIPFRVSKTSTEYVLTSPVPHGINQGEYIVINSVPYYVNSVGNEIYNSEKYTLTLLQSQFGGTQLNGLINGKRCTDIIDIGNATSQYYVHQHYVLTDITQYIIDKIGFESSIWRDERKLLFENSAGASNVIVDRNRMESVLFDYFNPYILSGITNNLGYTPTELYTTIIFRNGNGYFNYPPKVGFSFHFHDSWVDEHFDGGSSKEISIPYTGFTKTGSSGLISFTKGLPIPIGTILHGAFVEYNPKEMKERIISEAFHKITSNINVFNHGQNLDSTYSGATDTNPIGLFYQPHYRFKLRELSPYIESSDPNVIIENLPENAIYFPNEKLWRWRDLYDDGYIDPDGYGTDYPYLNDIHYIHNDINFYLRNEVIYTNKKDSIINFNKSTSIDNCSNLSSNASPILVNPTPSITPSITISPSPTPTITPSATP